MTISDQAAFEARINALSAELDQLKASRIALGDELPTRYLDALPYGTQFRDSDGDIWHADGTGNYAFDVESLADGEFTGLNPKEYAPLSLVRFGEDDPEVKVHEDDSAAQDAALADWERELLEGAKAADPEPVFQIGETVRLLPGADQTISAFALGEYPAKVTIHRGPETISSHGVCYDVRAADGNNTGIVQTVPVRFLAAIEATPAEEPIKVGDRVRVIDTRPYGDAENIDGKTGVVESILPESHRSPGYTVRIDSDQGGYWATEYAGAPVVGQVEKLSEPEPEPEVVTYEVNFSTAPPETEQEPELATDPTSGTILQPIGTVNVFVRPSGATSGARLEIRAGETGRQSIHLDREGTRQLAALLTAIADR